MKACDRMYQSGLHHPTHGASNRPSWLKPAPAAPEVEARSRPSGRRQAYRRAPAVAALVAATLALVVTPSPPASGLGLSENRVSLYTHVPGSPGRTGDGTSGEFPTISDDGAFMAFESRATNLVTDQVDSNNAGDIFLLDRANGAVMLVSHAPGSRTRSADGGSFNPVISSDGAFVAFRSLSTELVAGQVATRGMKIFLFSRATGAIVLVSHTPASAVTPGNGFNQVPVISADGSFVAFFSESTDLVAGQVDANNTFDIFLYRRDSGVITLVSHAAGAPSTAGNGQSVNARMSASGSVVAFQSSSTDLVGEQLGGRTNVFLFDRGTGSNRLVSHVPDSATTAANDNSFNPSLSADGSHVAFYSPADNLAAGQVDINRSFDVFLFERSTGTLTLVSHAAGSPTTSADDSSAGDSATQLNADGSAVVFTSRATNLVAGQVKVGPGKNSFIYDRSTGTSILVSHMVSGLTTTANSGVGNFHTISTDGSLVAFESISTDLVAGQDDSNGAADVFLFDRRSREVTLVSHVPGSLSTAANKVSQYPAMGANGSVLAFYSLATNLVEGQVDLNNTGDGFLVQRSSTVPVSVLTRLAGSDRIDTAIEVSRASFADGTASAVVIAGSGPNAFPDALAGAPLAVAKRAPLLLAPLGALDERVTQEVRRVLPTGGPVYILGGEAAIGTGLPDSLSGLGYRTVRLAGTNRYETAVVIATNGLGSPSSVIETTGLDFPDGLCAGALASHLGQAVLLTAGSSQAPATAAYIGRPGVTRVSVGGPAASADPGAAPVVGGDRYETCARVADRFGAGVTMAGIANGRDFPDALSGSAHMGASPGGPLLLVDPSSIPPATASYLRGHRSSLVRTFLYGGTEAVAEAVRQQLVELLSP